MTILTHPKMPEEPELPRLAQANVSLDRELQAAVLRMAPRPRPCFTPALLDDIARFQDWAARLAAEPASPVRHVVLASGTPGTYNLGGDLALFMRLIGARDRQGLLDYALRCVRAAYRFAVNLDRPVVSVALVEGNALGGGFEAALSCNVIIAERQAQMGFPEVLFNLFPGMGAYTFLTRRIAPAQAERLITSGTLHSAERLHEMGVVDVLAEPGEGEAALREFTREAARRGNALRAVQEMRRRYRPVRYDELVEITEMWVDMALELEERDLRVMERLVRAQDRRAAGARGAADAGPAGASSVA